MPPFHMRTNVKLGILLAIMCISEEVVAAPVDDVCCTAECMCCCCPSKSNSKSTKTTTPMQRLARFSSSTTTFEPTSSPKKTCRPCPKKTTMTTETTKHPNKTTVQKKAATKQAPTTTGCPPCLEECNITNKSNLTTSMQNKVTEKVMLQDGEGLGENQGTKMALIVLSTVLGLALIALIAGLIGFKVCRPRGRYSPQHAY